jgi:hypothetical protein
LPSGSSRPRPAQFLAGVRVRPKRPVLIKQEPFRPGQQTGSRGGALPKPAAKNGSAAGRRAWMGYDGAISPPLALSLAGNA